MPKLRIGALAGILLASAAFAQDIPPLNVTPSIATVLVGHSRPFRAVNRDGRPAASVRWESSSPDAVISGSGANIMVTFKHEGDFEIHAFTGDGSSSATVHVLPGATLPPGTPEWGLHPIPGCRMDKSAPADKSNGVFAKETCANGELFLALTTEGLENGQKWVASGEEAKSVEQSDNGESTELMHGSLCDGVKTGMSRDDATKLVVKAKLDSNGFDKSSNLWNFEEGTGECRITFRDNVVVKKQKVIGIRPTDADHRVAQILRAHSSYSDAELSSLLLNELRAWTPEEVPQQDDITFPLIDVLE
jgi:Bacterial Ig-like domain (group 2)